MATSSEVKAGLDAIAKDIATQRAVLQKAIDNATGASAVLGSLVTTYSGVKTTIDGYTPTGAFETLAKDELAKLTTEFQALKADADTIAAVTL